MKFNTKQLLSVFLTLNLVWVFVGCAFICNENIDCTDEVEISFEHSANFDEPSHEDSCPIKTSARMTTPERIVLKFQSATVNSSVSTNFSVTATLPFNFKFQPESLPPPKITSQNKRPFVLRI